jgi:hypothetical protein
MALGGEEGPRRMNGKKTAVVSESAVQAALRRGPARDLDGEEEKAMRMRLGAALPRAAALERKAAPGSDAALELLAFEAEILQKLRARAVPPRPAPRDSRVKEKIVRALRKKS